MALQAWANSTMDCMIAAFYSMAKTQLRMLRYDLEHLVDIDGPDDRNNPGKLQLVYIDSKTIRDRFVYCVKHHRQVLW